jgi:hypothetical protein
MKRVMVIGTVAAFALGMIACGSDGASTFGEGGSSGTPHGDGTPSGSNGLPEIGPTGTSSACVTEVASAELAPTSLVFIFDKSGSMGDATTGFDPSKRWNPVKAGMEQFFTDPYSKTLRASLNFFPLSDDTIETACNHPYGTPVVSLTVASDPAFASALDTTTPSGGTPTLPALKGSIDYAKQLAASRPGEKTAVVLVTDGEPGFWNPDANAFEPGCPGNTVANVAATAAESYAAGVPVYVIGVGPQLSALNSVAQAGGTTAAVMIDVNDPGSTTDQIKTALADIRKREVACEFALPPPPEGEQLDPFAVNVVLKNADGSDKVVLGYSKDCTDPNGWRYDDPNAPKQIVLCSAACGDAKTSTDGKVSIAFGCKTKIAVH